MQTLNKSCSLREIHYNIAWCSSKYTLPLASSNLLLSESVNPWQNAAPHILQQHMFTFQFSSAQKNPFFLSFFKTLPDVFIERSLILVSMLFMVLKTSLIYGITLASFKVMSHSPFIWFVSIRAFHGIVMTIVRCCHQTHTSSPVPCSVSLYKMRKEHITFKMQLYREFL